jgi:hypothetical protein
LSAKIPAGKTDVLPKNTISQVNNALPKRRSERKLVGVILLVAAVLVIAFLFLRSGNNQTTVNPDSLLSNQEQYNGLIDKMAKELWKRQMEAAGK